MPWLVECPGIAILGLEPAWLILTLFDLNADARKLEGRKAAWARNAVLINAARDRRYHSNLDLASISGKTVSAPDGLRYPQDVRSLKASKRRALTTTIRVEPS